MPKPRKVSQDLKIQLSDEHRSTPVARAARARILRSMTGLARDVAASRYPYLNANTLKSWENGREGGLTVQGAKNLLAMAKSEGIACSLEWLMYEIGDGPRVLHVAKVEMAEAETATMPKTSKQQIYDELRLFRYHYPSAIDLVVHDDGMSPFYTIGDYVAGVPRYGAAIKEVVGLVCIVELVSGSKLLRLLREHENINRYNLYCTNMETKADPFMMTNVDLTAAAPVVWHRKVKV